MVEPKNCHIKFAHVDAAEEDEPGRLIESDVLSSVETIANPRVIVDFSPIVFYLRIATQNFGRLQSLVPASQVTKASCS